MSVRLRATLRQAGAARYRQPGGAWDVPTLDGLARLSAGTSRPGTTMLADSSTRLGGDAVEAEVSGLAGGLRAAGVRRGDTVAWQLPNRAEAVLLFRACWRVGAVAVPLHHQVGPAEVAAMLDVVEPGLVLAGPGSCLEERPGTILVGADDGIWDALLRGTPVRDPFARSADVAVALFTSGSTGEPKAVLHTHRGLAYKARTMAAAHGLTPDDAVLMPAPLAHISGLLSGVLLPLATGMRTVLMERWDAERANLLVPDHGITFMIGPPVYFAAMAGASNFSTPSMAGLRLISCGSMTVAPEFVDATRAAFGAVVKRTYGSTEAPTVTTSAWDDPPERARDTDGHVVSQAELRVVDPATGRVVGPGVAGELELRGPELFAGYADRDQTRAALHGTWYRTGDLATVDGEGWLTIVGRTRDVIIRGGENIIPAEVERMLESHPSVIQAVVVGYRDERLGERVGAWVVADGPFGLEDCRAWCSSRGLARFKTPERVEQSDRLPTLSLGKPDRAALRRRIEGGTGPSS